MNVSVGDESARQEALVTSSSHESALVDYLSPLHLALMSKDLAVEVNHVSPFVAVPSHTRSFKVARAYLEGWQPTSGIEWFVSLSLASFSLFRVRWASGAFGPLPSKGTLSRLEIHLI